VIATSLLQKYGLQKIPNLKSRATITLSHGISFFLMLMRIHGTHGAAQGKSPGQAIVAR